MDVNNYGLWTLIELRSELRKRGAKLSGRKHDLVERYNRSICMWPSHNLFRLTFSLFRPHHLSLGWVRLCWLFQTTLAFRFLTSSASRLPEASTSPRPQHSRTLNLSFFCFYIVITSLSAYSSIRFCMSQTCTTSAPSLSLLSSVPVSSSIIRIILSIS